MNNKLQQRVIQVGDKAPLWSAQSTDGTVNLADYLGQMGVLLLFYEADWMDVCCDNLSLLEELLHMTKDLQLKAFGMSADGPGSHKAFAHQIGLKQVKLLTDFRYEIARSYGLLNAEGVPNRATVLIDSEGIVRWVRIEEDPTQARSLAELEQAIQMAREWSGQSTSLEEWRYERQHAMQLHRDTPLASPTKLQLHFWGTRGSIPVSGTNHVRYGGNTSCVSLTSDTGHLFVFDCGSGLRELGRFLLSPEWPYNKKMVNGKLSKSIEGYILLSHTHWDHIQGFPFFVPVFMPGNRFNVIGWSSCSQTVASILAGQMEQIYFPVSLDALPSELTFYSIHDGEAWLDEAKVQSELLKHPIPSTAYRVELGGKVIVYATDNEPLVLPPLESKELLGDDVIDAKLVSLAKGADILIHDAQYSNAELVTHEGWGHSSVEVAVDTAIRAEIKCLVLYHHDPTHDDETIDRLLSLARQRAASFPNHNLDIVAAHDGMVLDFRM